MSKGGPHSDADSPRKGPEARMVARGFLLCPLPRTTPFITPGTAFEKCFALLFWKGGLR